MTGTELLTRLHACDEAVQWLGDRTLEEAWADCKRGDWMLWIAVKLDVDWKRVVLAACDCAETALQYVPAYEKRPRHTIQVTRAYVLGCATRSQVRVAAHAALAANTSLDAESAQDAAFAAYAAADAAYALHAAYAASHAAYAVARAAHADAVDAAYAADAAAHAAMADIVRSQIPWANISEALNRFTDDSRKHEEKAMSMPINAERKREYQEAVSQSVADTFAEFQADLSRMDMPKTAQIAIDHFIEGITLIIEHVKGWTAAESPSDE